VRKHAYIVADMTSCSTINEEFASVVLVEDCPGHDSTVSGCSKVRILEER
jgi:hypothetical protein